MNQYATDRLTDDPSDREEKNIEEEIRARVLSALTNSAYYCVRRIRCSMQGGLLTLSGRVPSYHLKQMAQTVAIEVLNQPIRINNQLEVDGNSIAVPNLPVANSID